MSEEPTEEFHADLAPFLEVHDGVGAVVRLPDHYLRVQLRTRSWWKQHET